MAIFWRERCADESCRQQIIPFSSVDGRQPNGSLSSGLQYQLQILSQSRNQTALHKLRGLCGAVPRRALSLGENGRVNWTQNSCVQCDACIHVCPHDSSPRVREMTPEEVYDCVKKQIPFIRGISVSGGECMLWPDFLKELFKLAKKDNLSCLIDSNGTIPFWDYPELVECSDGVMLDIKAFDGDAHRRITDEGNDTVLKNAAYLAELGKLEEVRAVIVPELYNGEESIRAIGAYLAPYRSIREIRIKLIAYRPMGVREEYSHYTVPSPEFLRHLADILREMGFQDIIII